MKKWREREKQTYRDIHREGNINRQVYLICQKEGEFRAKREKSYKYEMCLKPIEKNL